MDKSAYFKQVDDLVLPPVEMLEQLLLASRFNGLAFIALPTFSGYLDISGNIH